MAKKKNIISKKQEQKLKDLASEMMDIAADLVEEYKDLDLSSLSELSSSITQIHEDSPFLDDIFKNDAWKRVIKNIPTAPKNLHDDDTE